MKTAITQKQYRQTAAFHRQAAIVFTIYGKHREANIARALAFLCNQRAARMVGR